jgi:nucleotide-binding universal stress UspA family protein
VGRGVAFSLTKGIEISSTTKHYGIIIGVDGSPASDAAVSWAAHDAVLRGVPLTLLHVQDPIARTWSQAKALEELAGWQKAEGRGILANASKIAHDIANETAQITINGELQFSAPGPTLVDRSEDAELIVVGTDGAPTCRWREESGCDRRIGAAPHPRQPIARAGCCATTEPGTPTALRP